MDELSRRFPGLKLPPGYARVDRLHVPALAPKDVGHGFGTDLALAELLATDVRFARRSAERLEQRGLGLRVHEGRPQVVALVGAEDADLELLQGADGLAPFEGAVAFDTRTFVGPALLRVAGRPDLLIVGRRPGTEGELDLDLCMPELGPSPVPTPDARAWAQDDPWLAEQVGRLLASGDPLDAVVAAGHTWRLRSRSPERSRALLEQVRAGRLDPTAVPARTWARQLAPEVARDLEERALARAAALDDDLAQLSDAPQVEASAWRTRLTERLRARDDLQSAHLVLQAAGASARLDLALADLDAAGALAVRALPRWRTDPSPQLERAAERDPATWWALPVLERA